MMEHKCSHLGKFSGEYVDCTTCRRGVKLKLYDCEVYGQCTLTKGVDGFPCCEGKLTINGHAACPKRDTNGQDKVGLRVDNGAEAEEHPAP
jgi:hypothetical protein